MTAATGPSRPATGPGLQAATAADAELPAALPESLRRGLLRRHMPALDGVRAIAALTVVVFHAGIALVPAGTGVLAFFVLSGFLITWLLLREDELTGGVSLGKFYVRRSLRIFPPFLCYWAIVIGLLVALGRPVHVPQAIASFFYVNNYYQALNGDPNTLLSHTWSLGVEEQFYLLWPAAFVAWRANRARLARALVLMVLAIWAYRLVMVLAVRVDQGYVYEAFEMRADHLLVGCLMAVALREGMWTRLWAALVASPWRMLPPFLALALSTALANTFGAAYRDTIGFIVDPVLVAILIVQAIAFHESPAARWLNARWIRYLGLVSYAIYLYHPLATAAVAKLSLPRAAHIAASIALTVLAASVSYVVVERPMLRLKARVASST